MAEQVTQVGQIPAIEKKARARAISPGQRQRQLRQTAGSVGAHVIMIITVIVCIFPLLILLETSFKPAVDTFSPQLIPAHPTLDNYKYVLTFNNYVFFTWLLNSLKIGALTTVIGLSLSCPAAYAFSRWNFLGKQGILLSFLITQMFPGIILLIPLYNLYAGLNLLDNIYGLVIAYATTALPFSVWMLKNFFDAVPKELDEAARVDGLGPFRTFWQIVLPLTIPGVAVVGFFTFMTAWNEFMMAFTFLQSDSNLTLPIGIQHFVFQTGADWQWLTASAVLVTIPVLIIFIWAQRYLVSGLTGGSVKG
jgi:arabinogalactan oligomer / maltooligosaccharide transport system permease protein